MLYTLFAFRKFKKLYGDYNIFGENPKVWTFALVLTTAWSITVGIVFIVTCLP
jgi:hypothetical protein